MLTFLHETGTKPPYLPFKVTLRSSSKRVTGVLEITTFLLDFLKSPSSCLFSSRRTKDFSYLIAANFSDPKTGRCAPNNQGSPGYPMGTELSNYAQRNVTCGYILRKPLWMLQRLRDIIYFCLSKSAPMFVKSEPSPLEFSFPGTTQDSN